MIGKVLAMKVAQPKETNIVCKYIIEKKFTGKILSFIFGVKPRPLKSTEISFREEWHYTPFGFKFSYAKAVYFGELQVALKRYVVDFPIRG